jgi:nucleoside-diphosphate-sugar epimerase
VVSETPSGIGKLSSKVYSDIRDIDEITSLDYSHLHREVDDAILTAGSKFSVPTAILCPPTILGVGHGPVKKRSIQVPVYINAVMERGKAFTLGDGQNVWDYVHVNDVADALIKLAEEALKPHGGGADWGKKGYYFCEAGEFKWGDFHKKIAEILYAKGVIKSADVEEKTAEDASEIHPWGPILWGGNARTRAERLRNLSWTPKETDAHESLAEMADFEIESARKAA